MSLNFKKLGDNGDVLIILHGLFGSLDNWMSLGKYWAQNHIVYLVDQRNHGQSPHFLEHSYENMAEDLLIFMNEQSIEKPIILGHSMGGKTAMEFAVRYPEKVKKLIVVDIAPVRYEVHHHQIIKGLRSIDLTVIKSRKEADEQLSKLIEEFGVRQFLLKNLYWKEKGILAWRFNLDVLANNILPISEHNVVDGMFEKPAFFVKGSKSEYILEEHYPIIRKKFQMAEIEEIYGAGHWVHAEKREDFIASVDRFLEN